MTNGRNSFGVSYPQILFVEKILRSHTNVSAFGRTKDIQFDIDRVEGERVRLVCLDEYTCGIARVMEALEAFPGTNILYVGGNWNGYTSAAKDYCLESQIGLYNSSEVNGALRKREFWSFYYKDKKGNPIYQFKAAE